MMGKLARIVTRKSWAISEKFSYFLIVQNGAKYLLTLRLRLK